jgi:hypothetical protein
MLQRTPLAPNNRNGIMRGAFLSSLESVALTNKPTISANSPTIKSSRGAGRPVDGSVGGSYRVKK